MSPPIEKNMQLFLRKEIQTARGVGVEGGGYKSDVHLVVLGMPLTDSTELLFPVPPPGGGSAGRI
jgi:hypothetical protein